MRVLVSGASSGIGLAVAERLARRGDRVALLGRDRNGLEAIAAGLPGPPAVVVTADATDGAAVGRAVAEARKRLGGLDAVLVNPGATAYGAFAEMAPEDFDRSVDVTFRGAVNLIRSALAELEEGGGGTIAVTGSVAGALASPMMSPYVAAKHGLRGLVRTLQIELRAQGSPVRIGLVAPGPVATPFWHNVRKVGGAQPPRPVGAYSAAEAARTLVAALGDPPREATIGGTWTVVRAINTAAPPAYDLAAALLGRWLISRPRGQDEAGILDRPAPGGRNGELRGRPSLVGAARRAIRAIT